jgi:hypothetical protein
MRDDFSKHILDILAKRVGIRCSNPGCRKLTTGPRSESTKIINIGVGAHITAASLGGPRFDPNLSSDERKSPNNGIWLCQNCAKLVDNDSKRYSVNILQSWKQFAENAALSEIEGGVVSQKQTQENQIDLEISYLKARMKSERHDYVLEIKVQNLGNEIIHSYHIDLQFPARVIEKSKATTFLVEDRTNRVSCFFRSIRHGQDDVIYPGDTKKVISFPYYMDDDIYSNHSKLFEQSVKATFYRDGFQPLTIEKPFGELQFF